MKFMKYFSLFFVLLCLLSSCGKGERNLHTKTCPPDKNINELVSKRYCDSQLLAITQLNASMEELNKQYPIECLRKDGNTYRVSYLGRDSVAVILFDNQENKIFGRVYSLSLTKEDYRGLAIGQSLESIHKLDPHGEYLFLYTGSNNAPKISTHYTKDGYVISVEYDEKNTIINVTISLI